MDDSLVSGVSFYGKSVKRKNLRFVEEKIEKRVKEFEKCPLPEKYQTRITGPSASWKAFFRQQEALAYARSRSEDLHVFAYESEFFDKGPGQRMYVAVSYPLFWHAYREQQQEANRKTDIHTVTIIQLAPSQRHHYEIIPEGSVSKLYFDLEFSREFNPDRDGSSMTSLLIQYVCCWMKYVYNQDCPREQVIELDASTDKKFSRHLVFQLPAAAFKDNRHAGNFVSYIFGKLSKHLKCDSHVWDCYNDKSESTEKGEKEEITVLRWEPENPEIKTDDKNPDEGRKKGCPIEKRGPGQEGTENVTPGKERGHSGNKAASPPTSPDKFSQIIDSFDLTDLHTLFVKNKHGETVLFCDTGVYTKNRNFRLFLSSKLKKNNPLVVSPDSTYGKTGQLTQEKIFMDSLISNVQYCSKLKIMTFETRNRSHNRPLFSSQSTDKSASQKGYQKSPYPEIDDFISGQLRRDGVQGSIRQWTYFSQGELLVYDIAHYRWCDNVKRHHKSNNIMFIADLLQGVYYQKCHDPECRSQNYKSPDRPLPDYVLPAYYFRDDEDGCNPFQESKHSVLKDGNGTGEMCKGSEPSRAVNWQIDASSSPTDASVKEHQEPIKPGEVGSEYLGTVNTEEECVLDLNEAVLDQNEATRGQKETVPENNESILEQNESLLNSNEAVLEENETVLKPIETVLKRPTRHNTGESEDGDKKSNHETGARERDRPNQNHEATNQVTHASGLADDSFSDDEELVRSLLEAEEEIQATNLWEQDDTEMTDLEVVDAFQMFVPS